jgi:hypothetical protein
LREPPEAKLRPTKKRRRLTTSVWLHQSTIVHHRCT